jgi:hypothetical protein
LRLRFSRLIRSADFFHHASKEAGQGQRMPLARIISSQHGTDESEIKRHLQATGYEVEVTAPGQGSSRVADLEIDLEYLTAAQAMDAALRMADDGADVFIAPGVVRQQSAPQSPPVIEQSAIVPASAQQQPTAEPQPNVEPANGNADLRGPSLLERVGAVWEERQRRTEERRLERERQAREEDERRRHQALELQRRREQEERARAEQERLEREQMTREAVLRAERARQIEESERRRAAELPRQALRTAQPPDTQRLAAMEAQMQTAPAVRKGGLAAPKSPVAPKPGVAAPQRTAAAAPPRPASRPSAPRAIVGPPRRIPSPRDRQWQRATLLASLVALMAMLGFAAAMKLRPVEPLPSQMLQNNAEQKVPFGPATISPPVPAAKTTPAPVATRPRATAVAPARKPAPRPSAAREKPVRHQSPPPRARRSANHLLAQDEVVVRHYPSASSPTSQRTDTSGIRRYSDQ